MHFFPICGFHSFVLVCNLCSICSRDEHSGERVQSSFESYFLQGLMKNEKKVAHFYWVGGGFMFHKNFNRPTFAAQTSRILKRALATSHPRSVFLWHTWSPFYLTIWVVPVCALLLLFIIHSWEKAIRLGTCHVYCVCCFYSRFMKNMIGKEHNEIPGNIVVLESMNHWMNHVHARREIIMRHNNILFFLWWIFARKVRLELCIPSRVIHQMSTCLGFFIKKRKKNPSRILQSAFFAELSINVVFGVDCSFDLISKFYM